MTDIEIRLQRIEAQLAGRGTGARVRVPRVDLLLALRKAFQDGWFTTADVQGRAEIEISNMSRNALGRELSALQEVTYAGLRMVMGASNGQRRFRIEPYQPKALSIVVQGEDPAACAAMLEHLAVLLAPEFENDGQRLVRKS